MVSVTMRPAWCNHAIYEDGMNFRPAGQGRPLFVTSSGGAKSAVASCVFGARASRATPVCAQRVVIGTTSLVAGRRGLVSLTSEVLPSGGATSALFR